jgi:subtilase family serine protease
VAFDRYRISGGVAFSASDRDPMVPAALSLVTVGGLDAPRAIQAARTMDRRIRLATGPLSSAMLQRAYDLPTGSSTGAGQTIGFTLWGVPTANQDLAAFAAANGSAAITAGQGPGQVEWVPVNGGSTASDAGTQVEVASDLEYAHSLAPAAHLKYFLSGDTCTPPAGPCMADTSGLLAALDAAVSDPTVHIVSNSWGTLEPASANDPFVLAVETSLMHAAAVGTTALFATGDRGADSGGYDLPAYPAGDPYALAVGGTRLLTALDGRYVAETAWGDSRTQIGSGGGCSHLFARPAFLQAQAAATCPGRAVPDVAADADPRSGGFAYFTDPATGGDGQALVGGTSLATALWAAMIAATDQVAQGAGKSLLGWITPLMYQLASSPAGKDAYHDVVDGRNNRQQAGPGWDEVTGLGSIDWSVWSTAVVALLPKAATSSALVESAPLLPTPAPTATSTATIVAGSQATPTVNAINATPAPGQISACPGPIHSHGLCPVPFSESNRSRPRVGYTAPHPAWRSVL